MHWNPNPIRIDHFRLTFLYLWNHSHWLKYNMMAWTAQQVAWVSACHSVAFLLCHLIPKIDYTSDKSYRLGTINGTLLRSGLSQIMSFLSQHPSLPISASLFLSLEGIFKLGKLVQKLPLPSVDSEVFWLNDHWRMMLCVRLFLFSFTVDRSCAKAINQSIWMSTKASNNVSNISPHFMRLSCLFFFFFLNR